MGFICYIDGADSNVVNKLCGMEKVCRLYLPSSYQTFINEAPEVNLSGHQTLYIYVVDARLHRAAEITHSAVSNIPDVLLGIIPLEKHADVYLSGRRHQIKPTASRLWIMADGKGDESCFIKPSNLSHLFLALHKTSNTSVNVEQCVTAPYTPSLVSFICAAFSKTSFKSKDFNVKTDLPENKVQFL